MTCVIVRLVNQRKPLINKSRGNVPSSHLDCTVSAPVAVSLSLERMAETLLFCFFVLIIALQAKGDPCTTHTVINNPYRSTAYKWTFGAIPICDNLLKRGWYRFTSAVGGVIPTTKPKPYHCGTAAPIWINGPMPTRNGQIVDTTACVNMFDMKDGCIRKHQISVKHCGNYFVYLLVPTRGCRIAYCAGKP